MTNKNYTINYIEFPATNLEATKVFYASAFGWTFTDWGTTYISFTGAGVEGGFDSSGENMPSAPGILVILYADKLEETREIIKSNGGEIVKDIFAFPGGRRFHFTDPNSNELAVWSDT